MEHVHFDMFLLDESSIISLQRQVYGFCDGVFPLRLHARRYVCMHVTDYFFQQF